MRQSEPSKTPEQLHQTEENCDQGQKGRREAGRASNGLTGRLRQLKRPLTRAAFFYSVGTPRCGVRTAQRAVRALSISAKMHGTSTGGDLAMRCMAMISEFVTSATMASAMMAQLPVLKTSSAMRPASRHRP